MRLGTVADLRSITAEIADHLAAARDGRAVVTGRGTDADGDLFAITTPAAPGEPGPGWLFRWEVMRARALGPIRTPDGAPDVVTGVGCEPDGGIAYSLGSRAYLAADAVRRRVTR